jgi:hypothetical protein
MKTATEAIGVLFFRGACATRVYSLSVCSLSGLSALCSLAPPSPSPMSTKGRTKDSTPGGVAANPPGTKPKRTTKQGKKPATSGPGDDTQEPPAEKGSRVVWDDIRTDRLVDWLEDNPEDRQKLFSDSSHDAKKENWPRHVAKGSKSVFHAKMAEYVFSVDGDPKVRVEVKGDVKKYAKAVENRITQ